MCERAFLILTGLGHSSIQKAREDVRTGLLDACSFLTPVVTASLSYSKSSNRQTEGPARQLAGTVDDGKVCSEGKQVLSTLTALRKI